ncbi:MAG: hypothetical protein Ct9H90mP3_5900 [Flammeovirgaceae bacterium]|nr:MAG: hypothetical protein Ct9H90mP3_5900 [Flammeovirgaceae bacterium]
MSFKVTFKNSYSYDDGLRIFAGLNQKKSELVPLKTYIY